jgi:hypothetical protein
VPAAGLCARRFAAAFLMLMPKKMESVKADQASMGEHKCLRLVCASLWLRAYVCVCSHTDGERGRPLQSSRRGGKRGGEDAKT